MELNFNKTEKIVGVFVVGVMVLLLVTVIIIGRGKDWFKNYVTYYTIFQEGYNLEENHAVKLFKTDIGKIKKITLVGNKVKIRLAIVEEFSTRIRAGSVATVEGPAFIGSEYISINPGDQSEPQLPRGGMIPTRAKRSIKALLEEFEVEKTAKKLVKAIQDISEFAVSLKDPEGPLVSTLENLNETTAHIERITGDLQEGKGSAGSLLKSRETIDAIHGKLDQIGTILDSVGRAADKTPGAMDQVQDNLDGIKKIETGMTESIEKIKRILDEVGEAVRTLKVTLNNIETGSRDVPEITRSTREGIQSIIESVDSLDRIVESVQDNFLIKPNLPPEPEGESLDAGLRR